MKILIIDNSSLTKIKNDYTIELGMGNFAKGLKDYGNEVIFFGHIVSSTNTSANVFKLNQNGIKVYGVKRTKNKFLDHFLLHIKLFLRIMRSDFIYIFYPNSLRYSLLFAKLFGKKYGLYIRGDLGYKDKYSSFLYKNAYTVYTVSDVFTDYVNEVSQKLIAHTIKPMLQFDYSDIIIDRNYNNKDRYELLFFGRITDAKGVEELIYAMSILTQKQKNIYLTIVGTGVHHKEVLNLTKKFKLTEFISFEGPVYDPLKKKEYYKNADIFILPSYNEGFPRSIYESMVFGTPIITTFVGGIPSLMKDNITALEIDVKSVDSIVDVVIEAVNNYEEKMKPIAENATKLISVLLAKEKLSHSESLCSELSNL